MAEVAPNYQEREQLYQQIIAKAKEEPGFYAELWFSIGINNFNEGKINQQDLFNKEKNCFEIAEQAFSRALESSRIGHQTALTSKYLALSLTLQGKNEKIQKAWELVTRLI